MKTVKRNEFVNFVGTNSVPGTEKTIDTVNSSVMEHYDTAGNLVASAEYTNNYARPCSVVYRIVSS